MAKTSVFDHHLKEYEEWFDSNRFVYLSELEAIRRVIPSSGQGVEIGIGSGLFAAPLNIKEGCDPSHEMRHKAKTRGLNVKNCVAEDLPYASLSFDYALMVTTICFVDDAGKAIREVHRVLKHGGSFIIVFIDKGSPVGQLYLKEKEKSLFYKEATFYSTQEILKLLETNSFKTDKVLQTVLGSLSEIKETQTPEVGYGKGSFVVISAAKV